MSAGRYDLEVDAGETFTRAFTWDDAGAPPVPADLTGYTARLTLKAGGAEVTATTLPDGGLSLGGPAGTIALELEPAVTAQLAGHRWWEWDLRLEAATGEVTYLLEGLAYVRQTITQAG